MGASSLVGDGNEGNASVLIRVADVTAGREIGWGGNAAESLESRIEDVKRAIVLGAGTIGGGASDISASRGWSVSEITASFGVTLAAEAGVILSKASAEATFEVTVKFTRECPDT